MNALITGSNRGIGLALAAEFAAHGWNVFATARKPPIPELEKFENVTVLPLDVTDDASVAQLAASLTVPIDVLVNNAAVFRDASVHSAPIEEVRGLIAANLDLAVVGCAVAVRRFLDAGTGGAVVNVTSHQARRAVPGSLPDATGQAG